MQIVIWDGATGAKVKELEGHSSYVKGIAWDPVGTYLASQVRPAVQQQQPQQQLQHTLKLVQCFSWTCLWAACLKWRGFQQTHCSVLATGRRQDAHRVAHGGLDAHRQGHRALPALAHPRFLPQVIVLTQLHTMHSRCIPMHACMHACTIRGGRDSCWAATKCADCCG